jgi:HSP20 family molecular chaperone IbpA
MKFAINRDKTKRILALTLALTVGFVGGMATKDAVDHKNSAHAVCVSVEKVKEPRLSNRLIAPALWDIYIDPLAVPVAWTERTLPLVPLVTFPDATPKIQTVDSDKSLRVIAQVPGMSDKDVKVEASDQSVVIKGHKKQEEKNNGHFQAFDEAFEQSVHLPCKVNADKVQASVKDGILTITLPKV